MNKKGQVSTLQGIIISLVIIGIVLGVGLLVLSELEESMGTDTDTIINESITPTDAGVYVEKNYSTDGVYCYHDFTPVTVINDSGEVIASGNYSYQPATGLIWNTTSEFVSSWNITYTYGFGNGSSACEGVGTTVTAVGSIPAWLVIIVVILIVAIVLAILFNVLPSAEVGFLGSLGGGSGETVARI